MITDKVIIEGLSQCGLSGRFFSNSGKNSLRGPCIKCGGTRRMVVFLNGSFPKWFFRCDLCGLDGWAPSIFPSVHWPDGPIEPMLAPEQKDYSRALSVLKNSNAVEHSHAGLTNKAREWWRNNGIPDSQQDFLKLGFVKGRPFKRFHEEDLMVLDAYTIPKYWVGWDLRNIDFRMIDAPPEEGKYRPFPGAPVTPFLSRPDLDSPINDNGIAYIVEGSKKAAVTGRLLDDCQVIGVPSSNSWAGIVDQLALAEVVFVMLDLDAWKWATKLTKALGTKGRQVTLPVKIDDGIIEGAITKSSLNSAMKYSRRSL